ncbi:MAG: MoaD/ThiS family protein [Verrucomicrobiota bacterium]|jgi:molybdopterin converting factor subunit 1
MPATLPLQLQYFAVFREQRGLAAETVREPAATPAELYALLRARHGFTLAPEQVRTAVNGAFVPPDHRLAAGDTVVFIPPVAGG